MELSSYDRLQPVHHQKGHAPMRKLLLILPVVALTGCSTNLLTTPTVTPNYASIVGMIQTNYPVVKQAALTWEAANSSNAAAIKAINAAIADADPVVASLSATSAPTSIQAVSQDLAILVATPAGQSLPTQTKSDITLALSLLNTVAQLAPVIAPLL
jgi:hypothetical protein